jgi:hypothetical protein
MRHEQLYPKQRARSLSYMNARVWLSAQLALQGECLVSKNLRNIVLLQGYLWTWKLSSVTTALALDSGLMLLIDLQSNYWEAVPTRNIA